MKGLLNIYTCRLCGGHIVTIDKDEGSTPFQLACRATEGCNGPMQSSMYRVFDQGMRPSHEWYKPDQHECEHLSDGERQHVGMGGLLLRELDPLEWNVPTREQLRELQTQAIAKVR